MRLSLLAACVNGLQHFQKDLKTLYSEEPDQLISRALKISLNTKKMKK